MALLTLGSMALDGFEVPAGVRFGGGQRLAVHKLIGGARVIDAMGRDDAALAWCGIFSGSDAGDRARMLDTMRAAGNTLTLAWDAFCYTVVISSLDMDYRNPWWIEYRISCTVQADLAQGVDGFTPALADSVLSDLNSAAAYFDVTGAIAATSAPNGLVQGGGGLTQSEMAVAAAQSAIGQGMVAAGAGLASANLAMLVSSAGSLAQLSCAAGYVGRCLANLDGAGS
jgi:hypothetical protein